MEAMRSLFYVIHWGNFLITIMNLSPQNKRSKDHMETEKDFPGQKLQIQDQE